MATVYELTIALTGLLTASVGSMTFTDPSDVATNTLVYVAVTATGFATGTVETTAFVAVSITATLLPAPLTAYA